MASSEDAADAAAAKAATALFAAGAALSVDAHAQATTDGGLALSVRYLNTGMRPLYAFDRLWTTSPRNEIVEDPTLAYRFVDDGTLQILLGLAPLPAGTTVLFRNVPYATTIRPGEAVSRRFTWTPPVREYSPYFPEGKRAQFETVRTSRIVVLVDSVAELPDLQTIPAPFDASAIKLNRAGVHSLARRAASPELMFSVSVGKRRDEFDRIPADWVGMGNADWL
jgi:hypothetical protein